MPTSPPKRGVWTAVIGWSLVALVLYVASLGPVVRIVGAGVEDQSAESWWRTLYAPVFALARAPTPGRVIAKYLNLWLPDSRAAFHHPDTGIWFNRIVP